MCNFFSVYVKIYYYVFGNVTLETILKQLEYVTKGHIAMQTINLKRLYS